MSEMRLWVVESEDSFLASDYSWDLYLVILDESSS